MLLAAPTTAHGSTCAASCWSALRRLASAMKSASGLAISCGWPSIAKCPAPAPPVRPASVRGSTVYATESRRSAGISERAASAPRELDVLRRMATGATNGEIAAELFLAETTVKTHIGAIFMKLGVRDRAAAIIYAFDAGIVTPRGT